MMKGLLPSGVTLSVTRRGRKCSFVYSETFAPKFKGALLRTVGIMKAKRSPFRIALSADGLTATIEAKNVDYHVLADAMCGEFLMWSKVGEMRLRDLLVGAYLS